MVHACIPLPILFPNRPSIYSSIITHRRRSTKTRQSKQPQYRLIIATLYEIKIRRPATTMSTALTPVDRLNQLRDIFNRFDMDADGSLTHLELAALLRSLGLKPSGDQIDMLFNNMDSNGNGAVEFDELVHAMSPDMATKQHLSNQAQLLKVFHSFDRDGNGVITRAELAKSMAKMGQPLTYQELTEMIEQADIDGDGVISFSEFARVMAKSAAESFGFPIPLP